MIPCQSHRRLAAGQPVQTDGTECAVRPELDKFLNFKYASQILSGQAVSGMPAHVVGHHIFGLPGDMCLSDDVGIQTYLQGGIAPRVVLFIIGCVVRAADNLVSLSRCSKSL